MYVFLHWVLNMSDMLIPAAVDDPQQVLLWGADEIAPGFIAIGLGMFLDSVFLFLVLWFVYVKMLRKYKDSRLKSYGIHMGWWYGYLPVAQVRTIKDPYQREWYS